MNSANSVSYYHGDGDFCNIMVQRYKDNGDRGLETEYYPLTKAEAELIATWAQQVFDSKRFRFTTIELRGWVIFLPERKINVRPPPSPIRELMQAIGRHPAAESDPSVIDALNAVEDALRQKEESK